MNRPGSLQPQQLEKPLGTLRGSAWTIAGSIALLPALILVVGGLSERDVPGALVHPVLVMGGLGVAFLVSLLSLTAWELHNTPDSVRVSCTIRKRPASLVVLVLSLMLLAIIAGYLFVENFAPRIEASL